MCRGAHLGFPSHSAALCLVLQRINFEGYCCCVTAFTAKYSSSYVVVTRSIVSVCQLEVFDGVKFYMYLVPQPCESLTNLSQWIYFPFPGGRAGTNL